jgi:hypothetical protein
MKVTIEHDGSSLTLEAGDMDLFTLMTLLIEPALLASGYHPDNVNVALKGGGV